MKTIKELYKQRRFRQQQEQYRLAQGRLTADEAAVTLAGSWDIPLCNAQPKKGEPVTIGMNGQPFGGHLLVVAPPTSQWMDQIICTLARWPHAALVVDSSRILHARTSQFRQKKHGPIYTLPGYRLDLGHYYRFWDETQARKLHGYLMPPYPEEDRHLIERSVALFVAVGHYAYARKRNLMHVLLDVADCDLLRALKGLETIPYALPHVRRFSNGQLPQEAIRDSNVVEAFSVFARQLQRYQAFYDTFDTEPADEAIPYNWVQNRGTIYLTYDHLMLEEVRGLVTAVTAGLVRYHLSHGRYKKLLLVLDAETASQLPHFTKMLQMVRDYSITVILVTPSWEGLRSAAGKVSRGELLSYFSHQLWYPPSDGATAQQMSKLLGKQLCSDSGEKEPVLEPGEILAWQADKVIAMLQRERPYRFVGQRLSLPGSIFLFQTPLLPPVATPAPRYQQDSLPPLPPPQSPEASTQAPKPLLPGKKIIEPENDKKEPKRRKRKGYK